jgi:ATP-dependent protease HslVU (ClpYQ) peptidase subunit
MTTIVGIQQDGVVTVGTDSVVTAGTRQYTHPHMEKVIDNHGFLIGGAGDVSACDPIMYMFTPPKPTVAEKKDLYRFMIRKFAPALRKFLAEMGYSPDKEDKEAGFELLIAYNGEMFIVDNDFTVLMDESGVLGVGSGSPFAVGALLAGADIEKALEIAANNSSYTRPPFKIFVQEKE